ncbi:trigger factor [Melioribacter roseus P3M-2]|uniref:Trigger factor n=1 Tax=Melioribacter roseus (strain DSM 23840 / JCM 17771 / VKM B-2668 / P3M-2) TaxID=1191523 RepID=I6Z8M3_MELRP|nr:trigger factor [Melioribacter roseus]AFN75505.1 trigger factor [Melioribacter roseus P3M-2]
MDFKVNQLSDSLQELEVNLSYDEIKPEIEKAYEEERKHIAIDGFRKGKAPLSIIKKLYGEAIEYKASEKIATKKFWDIVDQEKLQPISTPQLTDIDFNIGEKLSFKIQYEIMPKVDVKDYKGLEIEKPAFKVKEEEIEKEIEYLLKPHYKYEEADTVESKEYKITVDLQQLDESKNPVPNQRSENVTIDLNDEKVNPQIFENAKGKKAGDKFDFSFVDEHYHGEELHRQEYNYEVEIKKIEKLVKPELNEELIKKISNDKASTIEELRELMRDNFKKYYDNQSEQIFTNSLLNKVVENNDFTPPSGLVESLHKRFIEMEKENARRYGQKNVDEKQLAEYLKPRAEWTAKWQIIMTNIAEKENIKVEDSELEQLAKEESEKTGISVDKLVKYYKDTNRADYLLEDKVIKFLKDNAVVKEVDPEEKKKKEEGKKENEE